MTIASAAQSTTPDHGKATGFQSKTLYWIVSIGLAAVLLYWSIRGIQWSAVLRTLASCRLSDVAICCILISLNMFLRAARWRLLLSAEGPVPMLDAFWATSAGYFGNSFLPARGGELVRTVMISARTGLSRAYVLTTALSERMADAIVLVVISGWVLTTMPSTPPTLVQAARTFAAIGFCGLLSLAILPHIQKALQRLLSLLPIPRAMRPSVESALNQMLLGIRSFHNVGRLLAFLGFTATIWSLDGLLTMVGGHSLGLTIPFPVALLLLAALGLGSALPSTPGYVGVYQFVAVTVLTPFGFSRDASLAYILLFQALLYVVITFWGLLAIWKSRLKPAPAPPPA